MADLVCNIAKGRVAELHHRVQTNDPANSALVVVPVDAGAVTDATLRDLDTLAAILGAGVTERTANGWARKTLTDADLPAIGPDDTNDRMDVDLPDQTWLTVSGGAGNATTDLIICYDADTTGGTDANLIPLVILDFVVTPDGSDVVWQLHASGYFRAA